MGGRETTRRAAATGGLRRRARTQRRDWRGRVADRACADRHPSARAGSPAPARLAGAGARLAAGRGPVLEVARQRAANRTLVGSRSEALAVRLLLEWHAAEELAIRTGPPHRRANALAGDEKGASELRPADDSIVCMATSMVRERTGERVRAEGLRWTPGAQPADQRGTQPAPATGSSAPATSPAWPARHPPPASPGPPADAAPATAPRPPSATRRAIAAFLVMFLFFSIGQQDPHDGPPGPAALSPLARWLEVAIQHPIRTPLALLLLSAALWPLRPGPSSGAGRSSRSQL